MSNNYPALTQMGVTSPDQIVGYDLIHIDPTKDILRIRYKRPSGSVLPTSRSYEFSRVARPGDETNSVGASLTTYRIPAVLDAALTELDQLLRDKREEMNIEGDIAKELEQFETMVLAELKRLRTKLARKEFFVD